MCVGRRAGWSAVSVLFSEPKISQSLRSCTDLEVHPTFQCSSASRKFLNDPDLDAPVRVAKVSVLFSEPKISQSGSVGRIVVQRPSFQCSSASRKFLNALGAALIDGIKSGFSALQRAENFSIPASAALRLPAATRFSALQRAENFSIPNPARPVDRSARFSALQRAENFSIQRSEQRIVSVRRFQCSSASRKFLNCSRTRCASRSA